MTVTLTWLEVELAAEHGLRRHLSSLQDNRRPHAAMKDGDEWRTHIVGAIGELAFAKVMGRYYPFTIDTFKRVGDVGFYEVRTRCHPRYELIVRDEDRDDRPFVLVRGVIPTFDVVGWCWGGEAKRHQEWKKNHGDRVPAYFVPDQFLQPLGLLPVLDEISF